MSARDNKNMGAKFQRLGAKAGSALGSGAQSAGMTGAIIGLLVVIFLLFANFHAIYIKTGTPMLKYGLAMTFLQPFYSMWATWVLTSKYALGK